MLLRSCFEKFHERPVPEFFFSKVASASLWRLQELPQIPTQVFFCKFCVIFKNTFFKVHLYGWLLLDISHFYYTIALLLLISDEIFLLLIIFKTNTETASKILKATKNVKNIIEHDFKVFTEHSSRNKFFTAIAKANCGDLFENLAWKKLRL